MADRSGQPGVAPERGLPGVVIIGCPRSGTSLLAATIERRFGFSAPVESHFVRYFDALVRRVQPGSPEDLAHMARAVMCFLEHWVPVNNRVRSAALTLDYSLACLRPRLPELAAGARDYRGLVGGLFSSFAAERGSGGWVEQSVYAEPADLGYLEHYPEGTRFVHLVRDGRDVSLSWTRSWFSPGSLRQAASLWRRHVALGSAWGRAHPGVFLEMRYEDLVASPERALDAIGQLIGRPPVGEHAAGPSGLADLLGSGGTHDLITRAPSRLSVQRWRQELSPKNLAVLERIAGAELVRLGYPVEAASESARTGSDWPAAAWDRLTANLSSNNLKRRMKTVLPLWCWWRTGFG